ncbi:MAG: IS21 family transposase [Dehalococcoidia bacterium]
MVTGKQVRRLRQKLMQGKTQEAAAAAAGMSVRSARTWQRGPLPLGSKSSRAWRTRPDPFAAIWSEAVLPLLQRDPESALQATTVLEWLEERYPGRFSPAQLRTLQRRLRDWRALHGPEQEVFFPQVHPPGREAQMDFTDAGELRVNIAGLPFPHLFFEFILSHSGWRFVDLAFGETFEALQKGLQGALWALGGAPRVVRTDNLSAATHELKETKGRTLTQRYAALLEHYGLQATRTNPRSSHENGVAEQAHHRLKTALAQALIIRGSRDFPSVAAYSAFVQGVVEKRNRRVQEKVAEERRHLRPLPPAAVPEYTTWRTKVRKWSTIRVTNRTYSVPSRLCGHEVEVRQYADYLEVYYKGQIVERLQRVRGEQKARIDYRHIIWSLVRKPGAFARYRFREHLFPTQVFRQAYDALSRWHGGRADVEYVRILHLAASTLEARVEQALSQLVLTGRSFDYAAVQELAAPTPPQIPQLPSLSAPDLKVYDALLQGVG